MQRETGTGRPAELGGNYSGHRNPRGPRFSLQSCSRKVGRISWRIVFKGNTALQAAENSQFPHVYTMKSQGGAQEHGSSASSSCPATGKSHLGCETLTCSSHSVGKEQTGSSTQSSSPKRPMLQMDTIAPWPCCMG